MKRDYVSENDIFLDLRKSFNSIIGENYDRIEELKGLRNDTSFIDTLNRYQMNLSILLKDKKMIEEHLRNLRASSMEMDRFFSYEETSKEEAVKNEQIPAPDVDVASKAPENVSGDEAFHNVESPEITPGEVVSNESVPSEVQESAPMENAEVKLPEVTPGEVVSNEPVPSEVQESAPMENAEVKLPEVTPGEVVSNEPVPSEVQESAPMENTEVKLPEVTPEVVSAEKTVETNPVTPQEENHSNDAPVENKEISPVEVTPNANPVEANSQEVVSIEVQDSAPVEVPTETAATTEENVSMPVSNSLKVTSNEDSTEVNLPDIPGEVEVEQPQAIIEANPPVEKPAEVAVPTNTVVVESPEPQVVETGDSNLVPNNVVSTETVDSRPVFNKTDDNQPRAILTNQKQYTNLRNSKSVQKGIFESKQNGQLNVDIEKNESVATVPLVPAGLGPEDIKKINNQEYVANMFGKTKEQISEELSHRNSDELKDLYQLCQTKMMEYYSNEERDKAEFLSNVVLETINSLMGAQQADNSVVLEKTM